MNPRFSIIIPIYNLENYIIECIDSVLLQTYNSWEAIVVNDGSIDNSLAIINKKIEGDNRFKLIDKSNGGLSAARNDALNICAGDYIIFLDGDDWLNNQTLEIINNLIGKNDLDLLVHQMLYFYSIDNILTYESLVHEGNYTGIAFVHEVIKKKQYNLFVSPAKAYRRLFLEQHQIRFHQGILHEDGPFFLAVCHKALNVHFCKQSLYYYRQNRVGQITATRTIKNYEGIILGIEKNIKIYGKYDAYVNSVMLDSLTFLAGNYSTTYDKNTAFSDLRSLKKKKLILHFLSHSKTNFKTWFRGVLMLIDPSILHLAYKIYHYCPVKNHYKRRG